MKRTDLLKKLRAAAKAQGLELLEVRDTGPHTVYRMGNYTFPVARHTEINELTAQGILKRANKEGSST